MDAASLRRWTRLFQELTLLPEISRFLGIVIAM
jgi:hypothetical protein